MGRGSGLRAAVGMSLLGAAPVAFAVAAVAAPALDLVALPDGSLELRDGARRVAAVPFKTPPLRRGAPRVRDMAIADRRIVEIRLPVRGQPREEVWIAEIQATPGSRKAPAAASASAPGVIWSGYAGPRDADEETAVDVEVSAAGVIEYQTAAHVSRCDGETPRLFPRAWDFATRRFRPIVAPLPPPAARTLIGRRRDPAMPAARPIGGFHWTAASTTSSAGDDARSLGAPAALDDGNPSTSWSEGLGGDGRGEFLTARSAAGGYRVRGLRIVPGDASSPAAFRAANRPTRLLLALGPSPDQRFDVRLDGDGAADPGRYREPYWVELPQAQSSTCITVVVTEVAPGSEAAPPRAFGTTTISDIDVFTELDGADGARRLVADVATGVGCGAKVPLLVALGEAAVSPAIEALQSRAARPASESRAGRECLVEALAALSQPAPAPGVADALASGLRGASEKEERLAIAVLRRAPHPPVGQLDQLLRDDNAAIEDRSRAARALAALDYPEAVNALVASVGRGAAETRAAVIVALGSSPGPQAGAPASDRVTPILAALRGAAADGPARHGDLLRALAAVARHDPARRPEVLEALRAPLRGAFDYEIQGRAIIALGTLRDPAVVPDLGRVRSGAGDPVLRFLATRELAAAGGADAIVVLRAALTDADPRVRETAALGLGHLRDAPSGAALIHAAKNEPWPFVRRAELEALGRLCVPGAGDLMITADQKDRDEVRRAALVSLTRCRDARAKTVLLRTAGRRNENATLRSLSLDLLGEMADPATAPALAAALDRMVVESQADVALEGVAAAGMRALARVGGPQALAAALALTREERSLLRHAGIEALGTICDPGAGAAALRVATVGNNPSLAAAARAAQSRCAKR